MNDDTPETIRHILVALDGSPHSQAALHAAVRLATDLDGEIEGLFVEDETLLRAAQLPFSKEIRAHTAPPKQLNDRRMQRQLRYQAEYAEYTLQQTAEQAEVPYTFRSEQGDVTQNLLDAAADVDLVVLGKTSTASSRRRLGTTSRTLLSDGPSPVLALRRAVPDEEPILLYFDGSDRARAALHLAMRLLHRSDTRPLQLLLPDGEEAERHRQDIQRRYGEVGVPIHVHTVRPAERHRLSAFVRQKGGLVICPAGCSPLCSTPLEQFLYEIDRPLLVMR